MQPDDDEEALVRSVALQNASSILLARQRAEEELLRAKEALRESQERLHAALSAAGTGTFRWDLRNDALEWDENLDALFGLEPGETVRSLTEFLDAVHPDDRASVAASRQRAARDGAGLDLEFRVVWPDGTLHWIAEKGKTFRDADEEPLYVTGPAPTSPPSRKSQTLRMSEEQLRCITDAAPVLISYSTRRGTTAS